MYPPPVADTSAEPPPPAPVTHTVEAGDTLWGIASELLGPGADDAQITATWHLIHEQNRTLIGEDPDLIRPGWVLSLDGVTP